MTEPRPEPRLDPEQDEYVRRLLADARHDEPMPADVVDRLDDVLAGLTGPAPVVRDLAAERRRRTVVRLLGAAAAVVVVGIGLGQLDLGSGGGDADGGAAGGASVAEAPADVQRESAGVGVTREPPVPSGRTPLVVTGKDLRRLSAWRISDSTTLRDLAADSYSGEVPPVPTAPSMAAGRDDEVSLNGLEAELYAADEDRRSATDDLKRSPWFTCKKGPYGAGRLVAVQYRGNPAVVAVRPSTGDSLVVELLQCGTATVLRSVTVPMS